MHDKWPPIAAWYTSTWNEILSHILHGWNFLCQSWQVMHGIYNACCGCVYFTFHGLIVSTSLKNEQGWGNLTLTISNITNVLYFLHDNGDERVNLLFLFTSILRHVVSIGSCQILACKDLSFGSLRRRDYHFNDFPNSFPCAVLLNANRVGSTGKRTRLGVQGDHSNFQIVRFPVGPAQSTFISLRATDSLITNVSLLMLIPKWVKTLSHNSSFGWFSAVLGGSVSGDGGSLGGLIRS